MRGSLIALAAGLGAAYTGLVMLVCYEIFDRRAKLVEFIDKQAPPEENPYTDRLKWMDEQEYEQYKMTNSRGESLNAYLLRPEKPSDVYVFCSHGYRSTGKIGFRYIAKYWHEKGYNVFLIDQQANGESEGGAISFGHYESQDCIEWLEFMNDTFGKDIRIILPTNLIYASAICLIFPCCFGEFFDGKIFVFLCSHTRFLLVRLYISHV